MKYLLHADGTLPNLALMRLASYFRARGEDVRLVRGAARRSMFDPPGEAFGSSIFAFSDGLRARIDREWGPVTWGGTGVRVESSLSEVDQSVDWEAVPPDYSIYDGEQRSIGFTQRGCRLKCEFCVVPRKEGRARAVATIADIWRGGKWPKKILLLDNDFFGQRTYENSRILDLRGQPFKIPQHAPWQDRIAELRAGSFKVCFSQGINIRQVDDEAAAALATLEYRDNEFKTRTLYTAWDNLGDERRFKVGVATLARAGIPAKHLRVYMLVGYAPGETWEQIHHRFDEMVALGCEPYPMVYDPKRRDLKAFQRWAITGLYRAFPFADYNRHIKRDRARVSLPVLPGVGA